MKTEIAVTTAFGLESVLKKEITALGYEISSVGNGRIYYNSDEYSISRSNIFLRTAERIHLVVGRFPAHDFDELFDGIGSIPWEDIIQKNGRIHVRARSRRSRLNSMPAIQSVSKKSIIERLKAKTGIETVDETGRLFPIEIELDKDHAAVLLNTSGEALFKRGYRTESGTAPIKETLAAGLVMLSGWRTDQPFCDPFCGSGTIPIEAAMIKKNIPPGLNRHFLSMNWDFLGKDIWKKAAVEGMDGIDSSEPSELIYGYDADPLVLKKAAENAENAETEDIVRFKNVDVNDLKLKTYSGTLVTNPPYGERMEDKRSAERLLKTLKKVLRKRPGWSAGIITPLNGFESYFGRARRNRKLFNGNIKCHYYMYPGYVRQ